MITASTAKKIRWSAGVTACAVSTIAGMTALPVHAAVFTGTGTFLPPPTGIPNNIPNNNATGITSTITVPTSLTFTEITNITVTLNSLNHNFAGDLIASLTYLPTNQTVNLFNRIGRIGTGRGDNSNFSSTSTLTYNFSDAFTDNLWTAAEPPTGGGTNFNIPVGNYKPTGAGSSTPISLLDVFKTSPGTGNWQLRISDNGGQTGAANEGTGSIGGWSLKVEGRTVQEVPEPSSVLGLLALGLLGMGAAAKLK
jgi:subtilisin-like proprotein convertase family protein